MASRNFGALRCSGDETLKPGHQFKDDPDQVANLVSLLGVANNTLNLMKDRESPELSYQVSDLREGAVSLIPWKVGGQEDLSSWQLDLEGIQLVERGQLLAEKLVQSSLRSRYIASGNLTI